MNLPLTENQQRTLKLWLPAVLAGAVAWLAFVLIGSTSLLRSAGLALAVVGTALSLRWLGSVLAVSGALVLAFSPAFWGQTGGSSATPEAIVIALSVAALVAILAVNLSNRPYVAAAIALVAFAGIFLTQIGVARSLRFTVLAGAWLIFLLTRAVLITNPRPDGPPPARLKARYRAGILVILTLGVINDPLFVLFVPAVAIALSQSKMRIPLWYWGIIGGISLIGIYGMVSEYYDPRFWSLTAETILRRASRRDIPYLIPAGLHDPQRWLDLFRFIAVQFTGVGLILGVFGLARLSRWYPVLGTMSLVAFSAFFLFGLAYYGQDRSVLLLPMLVIQVMWMTYAVYTLSEWLDKSLSGVMAKHHRIARLIAQTVYLILPALLLWNIAGGMD